MDFTREIAQFLTEAVGGICITDERTHRIAFADASVERLYGPGLVGRNALEVLPWEVRSLQLPLAPGKAVEWEFVDQERNTYWHLNHGLFEKDGAPFKIVHMVDTSQYMLLSQEVAQYSAFSAKLSAFQSAMLEKITSSCSALFPVIAGFFRTRRLHLLLARKGHLELSTFDARANSTAHDRIPLAPPLETVFVRAPRPTLALGDLPAEIRKPLLALGADPVHPLHRLCAGSLADQRYLLLLELDERTDREALAIDVLSAIAALCVDNSLLREEIVYESEHDKLTGLFNKGKFLARLANEYPSLDSIALFNLDVNDLKRTNDTLGHEAGDKLLVKAADSIRKVTSDTVHGYRLGGDEYLMVACNVTAAETDALQARWERALEALNQNGDGILCVIAIGAAFAPNPYDLSALMKLADERMYEDKRRKKKPGEEIR